MSFVEAFDLNANDESFAGVGVLKPKPRGVIEFVGGVVPPASPGAVVGMLNERLADGTDEGALNFEGVVPAAELKPKAAGSALGRSLKVGFPDRPELSTLPFSLFLKVTGVPLNVNDEGAAELKVKGEVLAVAFEEGRGVDLNENVALALAAAVAAAGLK